MENNEQNQAVNPAPEPAQDLVQKVQAAKALASIHSLLNVGMFQHQHSDLIKKSIDFISSLHKQVLGEAIAHPDAHLVQDLVDYVEEKKKQEQLAKLMAEAAQEQDNE